MCLCASFRVTLLKEEESCWLQNKRINYKSKLWKIERYRGQSMATTIATMTVKWSRWCRPIEKYRAFHMIRAVILMCFPLWTNVVILHSGVRLGLRDVVSFSFWGGLLQKSDKSDCCFDKSITRVGMWITQNFHGRIIGEWYERIIDYSMCAGIHKGSHGSLARNNLIS